MSDKKTRFNRPATTTPPPRLAQPKPPTPERPAGPPPSFVTGDFAPSVVSSPATVPTNTAPIVTPGPVPSAPEVRAPSEPEPDHVPAHPELETVPAPAGAIDRANCDPPSKT